jgi:hypothetical protein
MGHHVGPCPLFTGTQWTPAGEMDRRIGFALKEQKCATPVTSHAKLFNPLTRHKISSQQISFVYT